MPAEQDRLLTPGEVAALFRVDPKSVTRWAQSGKLSRLRTPGGHARFRESEVRALLEKEGGDAADLMPTSIPPAAPPAPPVPGRAPVAPAPAVPIDVAQRNNRGW